MADLHDVAAKVRAAERALAASTFILEIVSPKHGVVEATAPLIYEAEIERHRWHAHRDPARAPGRQLTARTNVRDADGRWRTVSLHRMIWGLAGRPPTPQVDHEDGQPLNCALDNLRAATCAENQANRRANVGRAIKGVSWSRSKRKWRALIQVEGHQIHLGYFTDETHAQIARDIASLQLHGGLFARINDPPAKFASIVSRDRYGQILRQRVAEAEAS